jgi:deoxycytidine triphosphate deaminase
MIGKLGSIELRNLLAQEKPLVDPVPEGKFEGGCIELRLGRIFEMKPDSRGFIMGNNRQTPEIFEDEEKRITGKRIVHVIYPMIPVLAVTLETVNMPEDCDGSITPRGTLYRSGCILVSGNIAPGWHGQLTFMILNTHTQMFMLEEGERFCALHIERLYNHNSCETYPGQWQNGRVSTGGKSEKQTDCQKEGYLGHPDALKKILKNP